MSNDGGSGSISAKGAFAAELTDAMHSVAHGWHERLKEEAERDRQVHVARIGEQAMAEAAELRTGIEGDLARIDEWAKAATRQIEEDRARQVDAVHKVLDERLELHRGVIAREVDAGEGAIAAYLTYLEGFFDRLETESDPNVIVRLAGSIPPMPDLEEASGTARAQAEAELARVTAVPAAPRDPTVGPDALVPVMDLAVTTGSTPPVAPWAAATSTTGESDTEAVAVIAGSEDVVVSAPAAEAARSAGSLQRLAAFFGRGGQPRPDATEVK
jgi:hypothetical protein